MSAGRPTHGLVSYRAGDWWRAGVLDHGVVVDAAAAVAVGTGETTSSAADDWTSVQAIVERDALCAPELVAGAARLRAAGTTIADPVLGPPVLRPDKIICIGLNYREHVEEVSMEEPGDPILFPKFRNALIGDGAAIPLPPFSSEVDYEGELAVVIGRRCRNVAAADALDVVAGYMPFNDVSARDVQMRVSQWTAGKAIDGFGPCGPALVPAAAVPDVQDLTVRTTVNGVVLQEASTALMIFSVARLIEFVSSLMTLEPGDVIATGTPAGVGFTRQPPVFLRDGDTVEVEVEGVGRLVNPVRRVD